MSDTLSTQERLAVELALLDAMTEAHVVDVISRLEDDGRAVAVEQIGLQLKDGTTLYLCPDEPVYLTAPAVDSEDDETDIFDPLAWHRCAPAVDVMQEES